MKEASQTFRDNITLFPGNYTLSDLEYADDIVLTAYSIPSLQEKLNAIFRASAAYGLHLRPEKCKILSVNLQVSSTVMVIQQVSSFCYLGSMIEDRGDYGNDIKQRIAKASGAFNLLSRCLWNTQTDNRVKMSIYITAIRPILLYGAETWAAPPSTACALDICERRFMRRMLRYRWPNHRSNDQLQRNVDAIYKAKYRDKPGRPSYLIAPSLAVRQCRLRYLGHVLRRPTDRLLRTALHLVR